MAHYLFNFVKEGAAKGPAPLEQATGFLRVRMWGIDADEPHRNALASGDLILIYLAHPSGSSSAAPSLPQRSTIGRRPRHRCTRAIPLAECC